MLVMWKSINFPMMGYIVPWFYYLSIGLFSNYV
jgi:hypothetical protein